ncbi:MAG: hypothetical protein KJ906_03540 [Nanoarchaeota archaeon]|nr:hypothetical protein [Nanoarchaeota archaeon]
MEYFEKPDVKDIEEIKKKILKSKIEFIDHAEKTQWKVGRPERFDAENYLKNRLNTLYRATEENQNRIKLCFYRSRKYDLIIIAELKDKVLKVITYYNYMKKKRLI